MRSSPVAVAARLCSPLQSLGVPLCSWLGAVEQGASREAGNCSEREAWLCHWKQIFTSKALLPLGKLGILNIDFFQMGNFNPASFGLEHVKARVGECIAEASDSQVPPWPCSGLPSSRFFMPRVVLYLFCYE